MSVNCKLMYKNYIHTCCYIVINIIFSNIYCRCYTLPMEVVYICTCIFFLYFLQLNIIIIVFYSKQHIYKDLKECQNKCILTLPLPSRIPYIVNLTMIGVKSLSNIVLRLVFSICSHYYTNNTISVCKCILKYLIS